LETENASQGRDALMDLLPSRLATMAMPAIRKARSLHKRNNRGFVKSPRIAGWQRDGAS
jgi:hypothetical protein